MLADSSLLQCTCTIIIIHTVRSCKWKAIMTIYDGLIEMRKAGMNSTSLVFVNMISSSFRIQPIMKETCLYHAYQHAIKTVVMWYDRVVSSFERFKWSDLAHVHACSWNKINIASTIFMFMVIYILLMCVLWYCCFRWLLCFRAYVFEPSRPLACNIKLVLFSICV